MCLDLSVDYMYHNRVQCSTAQCNTVQNNIQQVWRLVYLLGEIITTVLINEDKGKPQYCNVAPPLLVLIKNEYGTSTEDPGGSVGGDIG